MVDLFDGLVIDADNRQYIIKRRAGIDKADYVGEAVAVRIGVLKDGLLDRQSLVDRSGDDVGIGRFTVV